MPLYPFEATLKDNDLNMTVFDRLDFEVEVHAKVISGSLETDIVDVRCDGHSMADSDDPLIRSIGRWVKAQALADLDSAGSLWSRVQDDLGLSYREARGWRRAS